MKSEVKFDESLSGLFQFVLPYPLYTKPEHYTNATVFKSVSTDTPLPLKTGKVYIVGGHITLCEVLLVNYKDQPKLYWTVPDVLKPAER